MDRDIFLRTGFMIMGIVFFTFGICRDIRVIAKLPTMSDNAATGFTIAGAVISWISLALVLNCFKE